MDINYKLITKNLSFSENFDKSYIQSSFTNIFLVEKGECTLVISGEKIHLFSGENIIIPAFSTSAFDIIADEECRISLFSYSLSDKNFIAINETAYFHHSSCSEISETLKKYFTLITEEDYNENILTKAVEYYIMYLSEKELSVHRKKIPQKLLELLKFIENNYMQNISLSDIAAHADISESGVYKLFSANLNISPKSYIRELRLAHATSLLLTSDKPISDIAYETGFYDQFYFSKEFKKVFGISPTAYKIKKNN